MGAGAAAAVFTFIPKHVLGGAGRSSANDKLNIACIGVGGQGANDVRSVSSENIVALCDADWSRAAETFKAFEQAKKYRDFRKMLEVEDKNIDAVTISTPDNTHAVIAMTAIKMGKHVYCQKPLCHDIEEVRRLTIAARERGVMTQMGTQVHATEGLKRLVEMIKSGMIGKVRRVDLWSGKDWGGGERPTDTPAVPETLDWDVWLGPAPQRPYHPTYLPENWRRWWDFGTGTLGDMACHIFDPAWWALDLDAPTSVEAQPGPFNDETYPHKSVVKWEFPAKGNRPAVTITWSDGENRPPRPPELEAERQLPKEGGLYYGESGTILAEHMGGAMLIPESRRKAETRVPEQILPRGVDHYHDWIRACKGGPKPLSNFDYAGPMSEAVLLGNVAAKVGQKLEWDAAGMKITNIPEANKYLRRSYRAGWTL
jgi:predicted dehydrogenase